MPLPVETTGRLDNWKELLLDLFYVVFLIKLGNIFLYCEFDGPGYLYAISHFLGIYMAKFELDQYLNKFGQKDLLHNVFFIVYSFGLFISILNINTTEEWSESIGTNSLSCPGYRLYEYGYYSGWLLTRGAFLIMYSLIGYFVKPQGIYSFITKAPTFLASILLISISFKWTGNFDKHRQHSYFVLAAALVEYLGFACWQIGIIGTYIQKYVGTRAYIPVNINHQSARTSSFILSVFGATFYQIMAEPVQPSVEYYVSVCMSFGLVLTLALMYFDVIPPKNSTHALGISRLSGMTWLMLHPIYGFCLFVIGVMFQSILNNIDNDLSNNHPLHRFTLGIFVAGASFCILLIRGTHKVLWSSGGKFTSTIRFLIIIAHMAFAFSSLSQDQQSVGALIGTHLTLCVVYWGIDLFKYRRMTLFLLQTYDHPEKRSNSNSNNSSSNNRNYSMVSFSRAGGAAGGDEQVPAPATTRIDSDCSIAYVPGVKQENWMNVLGDIRNYKGQRRKPMSPIPSSTHEDDNLQMIDGIPVIKIGNRAKTNVKISLPNINNLESNPNANSNISIPRGLSANNLSRASAPQRRGSAADASKLMSKSSAANNPQILPSVKANEMNRLHVNGNSNSNPNGNGNAKASSIAISRGKSAIDLRKLHKEEEENAQSIISFNRTLTQAQISGIARSKQSKDKMRGNFIEDDSGRIRERIIIRRKRSAPNKDSLNLPTDFNPELSQGNSTSPSVPVLTSAPAPPPLEMIHETSPVVQKPKATPRPSVEEMVSPGADQQREGRTERERDSEEENVIKLTRSR